MWLADQWNDYEVIDCSKGEKLERWGDYLLVRPKEVENGNFSSFQKNGPFNIPCLLIRS